MKAEIDKMIRVNQAGEYGAKRIYEGQIAFLKDEESKKLVQEMYLQELRHLEYFDNEVKKRKVRPTVMQPLWHFAAFSLGAISAIMGKEAAMACTVAVEEVIDEHYQGQVDKLKDSDEKELLSAIKKFQIEENEHKDIGEEFCTAPKYEIFKNIVRVATKAAIKISEKI